MNCVNQRLNGLARHDAVLHREHRKQQQIDDERLSQRYDGAGVDRFRHGDAADKADRVEKRDEKKKIGREAVEERQDASHCCLSHFPLM